MSLTPGTRLGHYEILAPLGSGGMGEVYRARDEKLGRNVAIKVLPSRLAIDKDALARFEREAKAVAALSHPNILAIHEFGSADNIVFTVTELLEGETLRARLEAGPLPTAKARDYALQIAHGLAAAHEKGIVHRDLKPDNVFIAKDGQVKILDFGIAKKPPSPNGDTPTLGRGTEPGVVLGTVGYMSPEQVRGLPVDARSDIFSLGTVFYEMLNGRRAFRGDSAVETMNAILTKDPPDITVDNTPLPPALERIVRHCLEKNREERFRSAHDLAFALENVSLASSGAVLLPEGSVARWRPRRTHVLLLGLGVALGLSAGWVIHRRSSARLPAPAPSFQQLTFRRGTVTNARFAADSRTVVYAAAWDGSAVEPFLARTDNPESARLNLLGDDLFALSVQGEMALCARRRSVDVFNARGTLARAPMVGGALREVLEDVTAADFSPDGASLAVVREGLGRSRLEYPIGRVLYETAGWIGRPRVSADGRRVAFAEHPERGDDAGVVAVVDGDGKTTVLTDTLSSVQGLAWAPDGRAIWYAGSEGATPRSVFAVGLDGTRRLIFRTAGDLTLHDVDVNGRALVTRDSWGAGVLVSGEKGFQTDLSWLDYSVAVGVSADGRSVLGMEVGAGGGPSYSLYARKTDGSPAVRLSEGTGLALSPDGRSALALLPTGRWALVPVGAGETRPLPSGRVASVQWASFFPDGRRVLLSASEPGHRKRVYLQELSGEEPRPITPEGVSFAWDAVSPDQKRIAVHDRDRRVVVYPVNGGEPTEITVLRDEDLPIRWSADGTALYVHRMSEVPCRVERVNLATGARRVVREMVPADPAGVVGIRRIFMTSDERTVVYTYYRFLSNLYLGLGLWRGSW